MRCDTGHKTRDIFRGMNILLPFVIYDIMKYKAVYRRAPATPGLLNIQEEDGIKFVDKTDAAKGGGGLANGDILTLEVCTVFSRKYTLII